MQNKDEWAVNMDYDGSDNDSDVDEEDEWEEDEEADVTQMAKILTGRHLVSRLDISDRKSVV